ncbi:MAG: hypothetical protein ABI193_18795 [Minicystis sp.]
MTVRTMMPALAGVACLALGLGTSHRAHADGGSEAAAEALFEEGKTLMAAGRIAQACPKFAESNRLDPGVGILLYLGDCYEKQGKLASAWATYKTAVTTAHARRQAERETTAQKLVAGIEPRLPKITVNVPAASRVAGLEVLRDELVIGEPTWGTPLPVDPGEHVVVARAAGREPWKGVVNVTEGKSASIEVPSLVLTPPAAVAPLVVTAPVQQPTRPLAQQVPTPSFWGSRRIGAVTLGVVGVGGVAAGAALGVITMSKWSEAKGHCNEASPRACSQVGVNLAGDATTAGIGSTVAFAVGGAAIGTAIVLWVTAGKADTAKVEPAISASPSSISGSLSGRF